MKFLFLLGSVVLLMLGHAIKIRRWSRFIRIYENPPLGALMRSMSLGYALNFVLPFKLGELVRAVYAGRRMKNSVGLSLATVILDRFLDILAVTVLFAGLYALGVKRALVLDSAKFYFVAAAVVLLGLILVRSFSAQIKRVTMVVCSIFNDHIRLRCEKFFWTLINTFRDLRRVDSRQVLLETALMWVCYVGSYALLGSYMTTLGFGYDLVEIIITLFSRASLDLSSFMAASVGSAAFREQLVLAVYLLLPPVIFFTVSMLPSLRMRSEGQTGEEAYLNLLPQVEEKDQLSFLDDYFRARQPEILKKFIALNRDVSIIADYSSGSNASTMLCMDKQAIFFRKYAFDRDGEKLAEQLAWLRAHEDRLPLCEIIGSETTREYCCYDMRYHSEAVGMFQFVHSHPIDTARGILLSVLDAVEVGLYRDSRPADEGVVEQYIARKVDANLELLRNYRELHELLRFDTLVINHREYRNLPQLLSLFEREHLREVFCCDRVSDIHGDLTIENIICIDRGEGAGFYLIDPNTGNILDSKLLDYAKLLQSLHGGYEFMMKTNAVSVIKNRIDFIYTRSTTYDELLAALRGYMEMHFTPKEVRSVFYHELVHWLRLLPYKLRKDSKLAPMFYAGFIMVANDVYDWFEKA